MSDSGTKTSAIRARKLGDKIRVVAAVISNGDRLLVCQRPFHKRHGGLWEFPGGKVEPMESDEQAARRELKEELALELVHASPAVFEVDDPGSPFTIAFVPVEVKGGIVPLDHSAIAWGSPPELMKLPLAPSDRIFVESCLLASSIDRLGTRPDA